jgi:thioredoxin reductase (NADPH)
MSEKKVSENTEGEDKKSEDNSYDFISIGAGGSGLAGGMYAARLGLKTLILGKMSGSELPVGGVITTTDVVENYPGFKSLSGQELGKKLEDHARDYDLVTIKTEEALEISKEGEGFIVKTKKGEYKAKSILFATGTKWRKLPEDVKGSRELENKGVHYCALCDGPLYKNKIVGVIGGSDSAAKDALLLSKHAKKVYIIYRGEEIHPEPVNYEKIKKSDNMEIINNTNVKEIKGSEKVEEVVLDKEYDGSNTLKLDGVFVAIGHIVLSDLAQDLGVEVNDKKEIIIDHKTSETNVEGIFAAGDVTDKPFKQLITGVGDACTAAYSAYEYISNGSVEN